MRTGLESAKTAHKNKASVYFWEARENLRQGLMITFVTLLVLTTLVDLDHIRKPAVLILVVCSVHLASSRNRSSMSLSIAEIQRERMMFDTAVGLITITANLVFMKLSFSRHIHDSETYHYLHGLVRRQMNAGRIPYPFMFFNFIPLVATSLGMRTKTAVWVVAINTVLSMVTLFNIVKEVECDQPSCALNQEDRVGAFCLDLLMVVTSYVTVGLCCVPVADIGDNFFRTIDADIEADSLLNNVLKNSIAGAACLIEIEQSELEAELDNDGNPRVGERTRLTQARKQLLHSMRWCMSRQVMIELATGSYKSKLSQIDIHALVEDISAISTNCDVRFDDSDVAVCGIDIRMVKIDELMTRIAVENGLFNALSHGEEDGSVKFTTILHESSISFVIENTVAVSSTSDSIIKKLQVEVEKAKRHCNVNAMSLATVNSSGGLYRISMAVSGAGGCFDVSFCEATCSVVLIVSMPVEYVMKSTSTLSSPVKSKSLSDFSSERRVQSNGPLDAGGSKRRSREILSVTATTPSTASNSDASNNASSPGYSIISASTLMLRVFENDMKEKKKNTNSAAAAGVTDGGDDDENALGLKSNKRKSDEISRQNSSSSMAFEGNILDCEKDAKRLARGPHEFPPHLKICAIDDSKLICKGYERLLLPMLKCNSDVSSVCCPKTREEVDEFLKTVLPGFKTNHIGCCESSRSSSSIDKEKRNDNDGGFSSGETKQRAVDLQPADIVILDQNIDLNMDEGLVTVLGTDLALELRSQHFKGLVIIRSANSSASDFDFYISTRAVDSCAGKSESHKELAARIANIYAHRSERSEYSLSK